VQVIKKLLKKACLSAARLRKTETLKQVAGRDQQFGRIAELQSSVSTSWEPYHQHDTEKKELLGNFYRDGKLYATAAITVNDHDFKSFAKGVVIPHGLYDVQLNKAMINIGSSCDTVSLLAIVYGSVVFPRQTGLSARRSILLLCDGGGSMVATVSFQTGLTTILVDEIGIEIRVAHYPAYCSKYNPIEHRFFPHVTRAC